MQKPSFRAEVLATATEDPKWNDLVRDTLDHRERNRRNLLIAGRVLMWLKEQGQTKAWLAGQMGVSAQHVGKVLKGKGNMTLKSIEQLEAATGLTLLEVPPVPTPAPSVVRRQHTFEGVVSAISGFVTANVITPAVR